MPERFCMVRNTEQLPSPIPATLLRCLGPLAALLLAMQLEFYHMKQAFEAAADEAINHIETKAKTFEVALEGFAHFLAIAGNVGDNQVRAYVQGIRELHPDLYMFEIASRVEQRQRDAFEQAMRARGYSDFVIHSFDFDGERQVTSVGERPVYYPIRFIEPENPDTTPVLGLDLGGISTELVDTLMESLASSRARASHPFELLEGGMGYVIYSPVEPPSSNQMTASRIQPLNFAMLVVRSKDLLPGWVNPQNGYSVSLSYPQANSETRQEMLTEPVSRDGQRLLSRLIGPSTRKAMINSESQPFEMTLSQSIHWSDFRLGWMLAVILSGSWLSFYMARGIARSLHRKARAQEAQQQLYRRANFDSLTQLPNLDLLVDRAEQAIRIAVRSGTKVAICYLDIDQFKPINDRWGHDAGDALLAEIATRLQQSLRDEDTAARIHGDEFVVLLPNITDQSALALVARKILSIFDLPFSIAGQPIRVRGSIGTVLFPDEAHDLDEMLKLSDTRMYAHKRSGVVSVPTTAKLSRVE